MLLRIDVNLIVYLLFTLEELIILFINLFLKFTMTWLCVNFRGLLFLSQFFDYIAKAKVYHQKKKKEEKGKSRSCSFYPSRLRLPRV